jgi:nucleoside-triphosphatase THEP1
MVRGLLSPARLEDGLKTGIEVVDVRSGTRRLLASLFAWELCGPQLCQWSFDSEAFAWGNAVLKRTLPCDLFVLDELGPLEFDRQQGWIAGFDFLDIPAAYQLAIVVVRPECVETFLQRYPRAETVTIHNTAEIDRLVEKFLERYWEKT